MESDLAFRPLTELSRMLATRAVSSREIAKSCLARIETYDAKLHAFVEVYTDAALAAADAADLERRAGLLRGPLHGLPIAVKDLLHIKGRATSAGSRWWMGRVADHSATAVERLLAAGMIPLGKTHLVEFAFGVWGCDQPMGAPWNAWDPTAHRAAAAGATAPAR